MLCMKKIVKILKVKHNNGEDHKLYPLQRNIKNATFFYDVCNLSCDNHLYI